MTSLNYYLNKFKIAVRYSVSFFGIIKYFLLTSFYEVFCFKFEGRIFYIRKEDLVSLNEIFEEEEYSIINNFPKGKKHLVLDLGANIGLFSLYFLNRYPSATIISVEASKSTFRILQKTIDEQVNSDWEAINNAVYSEETTLRFSNSGTSTARKIINSDSNCSTDQCETITLNNLVSQIISKSEQKEFYITIKMDIEGAEEKVVLENSEWLRKVDFLIIELHEVVNQIAIIDTLKKHFIHTLDINRGISQKPLLLFSNVKINK
jgi:FkbM family methyltransferase